MYLDANNLYGYAMSQSLPTGNLKFLDPINFYINKINENDKYGYILQVDLECPHELHDSHSDYPLAPERLLVDNNMLSQYLKEIKNKLDMGYSKVEKLVPNLFDKKNYVVHFRNLKFYLAQGLKLIKIHRILQFEKSHWLKTYIDSNTEKRKVSICESEKNFFKLMTNLVFGKTIENVRKRINCEVVTDEKRRDKLLASPCFEKSIIVNENVKVIKSKTSKSKIAKTNLL